VDYYPDGGVKSLRLEEKNVILTHAGELIPSYGEDSPRRKYKPSVSFHENGMIRSVSLEEQQEVMTPIGEFPAELVTFYDTGELKRVFPLDGKISGYWSEEDERQLGISFSFEFDFAAFRAMLVGLCFYKSGAVRSVTLFPGEEIDVSPNPGLTIRVRTGFSLAEDGTLTSLEPAAPTKINSPIGSLLAFDAGAAGVHADSNSLQFDALGRVTGLKTSGDRILVCRLGDGALISFAPQEVQGDDEEEGSVLLPLTLRFDYEEEIVSILDVDGTEHRFSFRDDYIVKTFDTCGFHGCSGDCSSCGMAGK
jgi:hypothetical protein